MTYPILISDSLCCLYHAPYSQVGRSNYPTLIVGAHGKPVMFLHPKDCNGVLGRTTLLIIRIRMFLGLPDPSLFCLDPNPFIKKQKSKKTLDFHFLVTSFWLFIYESCSECMKKPSGKNLFFVGILSANDEKSRIRIRKSVVRITGSGSVHQCHGSTTMVLLLK
jgi:hypothetical protein